MPAPHHSVFTGHMPFLLLNQQRQSTEGTQYNIFKNINTASLVNNKEYSK